MYSPLGLLCATVAHSVAHDTGWSTSYPLGPCPVVTCDDVPESPCKSKCRARSGDGRLLPRVVSFVQPGHSPARSTRRRWARAADSAGAGSRPCWRLALRTALLGEVRADGALLDRIALAIALDDVCLRAPPAAEVKRSCALAHDGATGRAHRVPVVLLLLRPQNVVDAERPPCQTPCTKVIL